MKTNLLIATALFTGAVIADAQNRYFDSASSGTTWDGGTTSNWGTGTGGPYNATTFGSYNIAQFEGTGATINSAGVGINGATFAANGYTIQGSTVTLGSPGGGPALTVNAGIKNLFNTDPPFANSYDTNTGSGSSWEPRVADPRGRSYIFSVDYKFL